MSEVTDLLKKEIEQLDDEIVHLEVERDKRMAALATLGEQTVEASVRVTARAAVGSLRSNATTPNVEAVKAFIKAARTVSQRDVAVQLDLAPGTVSKAVHALEADGEIRQDGKEGRSTVWTTQGVGRRRNAPVTSDW